MRGNAENSVGRLKERLTDLVLFTHNYARLRAIEVIDEASCRKKAQLSLRAQAVFEVAQELERWAKQQFHSSTALASWDDRLNPQSSGALSDGEVDRKILAHAIEVAWASISTARSEIVGICSSSREFSHLGPILDRIFSRCASPSSHHVRQEPMPGLPARTNTRRIARKVLSGPSASRLDPIFAPEYSLQEFTAPYRDDRLENAVPYFWTLSTREAMVCDSCLLSAVEYDGLPLQFYSDMARQAADEARHAVMYLDLALELMPDLLKACAPEDKTARIVRDFLNGRRMLPVPREGNLYSCMWNAVLEERLALMQITTEGAAVASTRKAIHGSLAEQFERVKRAFEIDYYDEVAHTRIGTRWMRHLCPDATERMNAIENAKLLRGILLLSCFVSDHGVTSVGLLVGDYENRGESRPPNFFLS